MLTQTEADLLIGMQKEFVSSSTIEIPPGTDQSHNLLGDDKKEQFLLDIWRGTFRLSRLKYQTRGKKVIVLVRLDIDGAPHTNPDGIKIDGSHIHIYREGFETKWAYPLDPAEFNKTDDIWKAFRDFCRYCNIQNLPRYQSRLL